MGFWDDVNNALGYQSPKNDIGTPGMWDALGTAAESGVSPTGINPQSSIPLSPPPPSPYAQTTDAINAVIQQNVGPYNIIDIDPRTVSGTNLSVSVNSQVPIAFLLNLYGRDPNYLNDWQTVKLPIQGTFFKFEFLPAQHFGASELSIGAGASAVNSSLTDESGFPPQQKTDGFSAPLFQRTVIVQFGDVNSVPILCTPGQVYQGQFNSIFVTFGYQCPRLRFIAGSKSLIIDNGLDKIVNKDLAFGPGHGLWENPGRHCVPFCLNTNTTLKGPDSATIAPIAPAANVQTNLELIQNPPSAKGIMVGWVTNFDLHSKTTTNANPYDYRAGLYVRLNGTLQFERSICEITGSPIYPLNIGGGAAFSNHVTNKVYATPRRFTLAPGESLFISLLTNDGNTSFQFVVEGYSYSMMVRNGPTGQQAPYRIFPPLLQHPFPDDAIQQLGGNNTQAP